MTFPFLFSTFVRRKKNEGTLHENHTRTDNVTRIETIMTARTHSFTFSNIFKIVIPIVVSLLVGALAGYLQKDSITNWYPHLNKPMLTPPDAVFPIVWTILYIFMGLSIGLIYLTDSDQKPALRNLFIVQLFLNFLWCVIFFVRQNILGGLICIILLDWIVIWYAIRAWPVRKLSSILFWPYILWISFATYLNLYIYLHN